MHEVPLTDAEKQLRRLTDEAARGEEVVIMRDDGAAFALVPRTAPPRCPTFGSAAGEVWMSDDFDAPLDDFDAYTPS